MYWDWRSSRRKEWWLWV